MNIDAYLASAVGVGLLAPEPISCPDWVQRHGMVKVSDVPGPYDVARVPYTREMFDAIDDHGVRQISIIKASQVGITEWFAQAIGYHIAQRPRHTMIVYPTADLAVEANRDRITPTLALMKPIRESRLRETRKDGSARVVRYVGMAVQYRGASTDRQLESWPCGLAIVDELDRCGDNTVHLVRQRTKTYADAKLIVLGKPGMAGRGIDAEYAASDRRVYYVPCPSCGEFHARLFKYVRWLGRGDDGKETPLSRDTTVDETQARDTACCQCPKCEASISAKMNQWQLDRGVWVPAGAKAVGGEDGRGVLVWPNGEPVVNENRGYHVPELLSGLLPNPYAYAAGAYVRRRGVIDADFAADHEGRAWVSVSSSAKRASLRSLCEPGHKLGVVPNEAVVLVAGVDVQHFYAYVHVVAYSARMARRWTVHYERVPLSSELKYEALDDVLYNRRWKRADGQEMRLMARFMDSGDGDMTQAVYRYCASRDQLWALKAAGRDRSHNLMVEPYTVKILEPVGFGGGDKPATLLRINSHAFKQRVHRALGIGTEVSRAPAAMGEEQTPQTSGPTWVFPEDCSDNFIHQMESEECVPEHVVHDRRRVAMGLKPRNGAVRSVSMVWVVRQGYKDNHYFDTAVYAEAGAFARQGEQITTCMGLVRPKPPAKSEDETNAVASPLLQRAREGSLIRSGTNGRM